MATRVPRPGEWFERKVAVLRAAPDRPRAGAARSPGAVDPNSHTDMRTQEVAHAEAQRSQRCGW